MRTLLTKPSYYFKTFGERSPNWSIAYLGYYLVAFVEAIGNLSLGDTPIPTTTVIVRSTISSIWCAVINLLAFGIFWMYLGSKIVGGKAPFKRVVQAVGYAFVWPGVLSLVTVPLMLVSSNWESKVLAARVLLYVVLPVQLVLGLAGLVCSVVAVKQLNGFGWLRSLAVAAWFPFLLITIVSGLPLLR